MILHSQIAQKRTNRQQSTIIRIFFTSNTSSFSSNTKQNSNKCTFNILCNSNISWLIKNRTGNWLEAFSHLKFSMDAGETESMLVVWSYRRPSTMLTSVFAFQTPVRVIEPNPNWSTSRPLPAMDVQQRRTP